MSLKTYPWHDSSWITDCIHCSIRNNVLDEAARQRQDADKEIMISIDGRWSHRRQALEGTVTCFDAHTKEILELQHIGKQPSYIAARNDGVSA